MVYTILSPGWLEGDKVAAPRELHFDWVKVKENPGESLQVPGRT